MTIGTLLSPFSQKCILREGYLHNKTKTTDPLRLVIDCNVNWHWSVKNDPLYVEIARNFEELVAAPFELYSTRPECIVESQPTWDMTIGNDKFPHGHEKEIAAESGNPCPKWRFEHLAYYAPAHTNRANRYGIHLTKRGIARVAYEVHQLCPTEPIEIIQIASVYKLFAHETCHAWIEDICSLIDFSSGTNAPKRDRRYAITNRCYNGYIFMEEAICNSAAYGWLNEFLQCSENNPLMPAFSATNILDAFEKWMRNQPRGYRDFLTIRDTPHQSEDFVRNLMRLCIEIYGIDAHRHAVSDAIGAFFGNRLSPDGKRSHLKHKNRWDCLWIGEPPVHIEF